MTTTIKTIAAELVKRASKVAKRVDQRFSEAASPWDYCRQGDVYCTALACVPRNTVRVSSPVLQLAPGTTRGSRHCLDSLAGIEVYAYKEPSEFDGPILKFNEERTITHPQHGNWIFPAGSIVAVSYQRTQDALDRAQRVAD